MPKNDRAMTRAVRAGMSTTGLTYTQQRQQVLDAEQRREFNDEAARDAFDAEPAYDEYDEYYYDAIEEAKHAEQDEFDEEPYCGECGSGGPYGCSC